ncbi:Hypothetical protein NTJ_02290 [Nesidiocoris tenuis]|uniref:Uncharacterized protein n=1 Tax=Nesidiocoris tenuis TaxID=355587 RepID=A0ABN7ABU1_9HEMI|nr:Hypothetical protein NTJ_02290 [Nesidiocoris tenuis]
MCWWWDLVAGGSDASDEPCQTKRDAGVHVTVTLPSRDRASWGQQHRSIYVIGHRLSRSCRQSILSSLGKQESFLKPAPLEGKSE